MMLGSRPLGALLALLLCAAGAAPARAEATEVRIARGFPISYLPFMVMEQEKLLEKHAKAAGLGEVKVTFASFSGPNVTTDALLSGNVDFVAGGVPSLLTLWTKTKGGLGVKGVASVSAMPIFLSTREPRIKTLADIGENDQIALPAVKVSVQAILLQMASEKAFGPGQHARLDSRTVSLGHPDALAAMLAGATEVNCDFSAPPYQYIELADARMHRILSSYEVLGGPATFNATWTTGKFHDANPKLYGAFVAALQEGMDRIRADKRGAAQTFMKLSQSKNVPEDLVVKILDDPDTQYTRTPMNVMKYADFMHRIGSIKEKPAAWQDLFFPEAHDLKGS
jgi:NitT/TauT family transport system substrate-binding protein